MVAAALLVATASPAAAQLSDLLAIRSAAAEAAAASRALAARDGAAYQAEALAAVRASCRSRGVTRLDEIAPVETSSDGAALAGAALLALDFTTEAARSAVEPIDGDTVIEPDGATAQEGATAQAETAERRTGADPRPPLSGGRAARGLVLVRGQVRTTEPIDLARDDVGTIEVDLVTAAPGHVLLGWSDSADAPRLRRNNARIELVGDGRVHTYAIDAAEALTRGLASGASVRRLFVLSRGEAPIEVRALRVLPRVHRYAAAPWGTTHESRGGELRSVLYAHAGTALAFDVDVPAQRPVLEAGLAVLTRDGVMEFEAAVTADDATSVLLKRLVANGSWHDESLDLARWAGRRVRIRLAVRGTHDAIALWSSPLVRPRLGDDRTEPLIVMLEDALRADRLSLYGGPVASPAHERIAAGGVVFERAFAQATQTRSSVPSVMTSLLPSATGTWDFSDALSDRYVTLAEVLRACGFATASFLQNGNAGAYAGLAQGFDVVFPEEGFGPRAVDLVGPGSKVDQWIARQRGRPYFAYVHVLDPHGPFDPAVRPDLAAADSAAEVARDRAIDAAWLQRPTAEARRILYDAEVAANDAAIGGFLDRLASSGDLARATIAVVADHGEFLGEHGGMWRHHPPGHVEVARIPFVLRPPSGATDIRRVREPVALLDLAPTLWELAGIDASRIVVHGRSLAAALRGEPVAERAVPADEMLVEPGERRALGCGSFATGNSLWLLSCTHDEDFVPGRLLVARSGEPAPLRRFALAPDRFGVELPADGIGQTLSEGVARGALLSAQEEALAAWRHLTDAEAARITSEPETSERLRALGYLE